MCDLTVSERWAVCGARNQGGYAVRQEMLSPFHTCPLATQLRVLYSELMKTSIRFPMKKNNMGKSLRMS